MQNDRRFRSDAYTGRKVAGAIGDLVIDLAGLSTPWPNYPILRQHDPDRIAGQSDQQDKTAGKLVMRGQIFAATPAGAEVIQLADRGFKWQSSVGIEVSAAEMVKAGESTMVNGTRHEGPLIVVRKAVLRELSAVPAGADGDTTLELT